MLWNTAWCHDVAPCVHIDIWSDVICPWCYLGKRRFEQALHQLGWGPEDVTVHWHAYQLDPRATAEPGDLRRAIERKYGPGSYDAMTHRLVALGEPERIDYRFDLAQRVSTLAAHRLLACAWATAGAELQGALKERLLHAYFTEGANVADHPTLVRLAGEAGLDTELATRVLADDAYSAEVADDLHAAADLGLTGVPAFVVNERMLIPGAQDTDTFVRILERISNAA